MSTKEQKDAAILKLKKKTNPLGIKSGGVTKRKGVSIDHSAVARDDDDDMDMSDAEGDVTKTCEDTREDANNGEGVLLEFLEISVFWNCFHMNVYCQCHVVKW